MLIALADREPTWRRFGVSLIETFATTPANFVIAIGANLLGRCVTLSGADMYIADTIVSLTLGPVMPMVGIVVIYLAPAMFLDPMGAMLLTLPVVLPVAGFELLWFGLLVAKLPEIGMITPPIGLNLFVLKNVAGNRVAPGRILRGLAWFPVADLVVVAVLLAFPGVTLFLPAFVR